MKDLRKVLAVIIAAAMVFGVASCAQPLDDQKAGKRSETEEDEEEDGEVTEESEETDETEESEVSDETEPTEETEETSVEEIVIDDFDDLRILSDVSGADVVSLDDVKEDFNDYDKLGIGFLWPSQGDEICDTLGSLTITVDDKSALTDNCTSLTCFYRCTLDDEDDGLGLNIYERVLVFEYEDEESVSNAFKAMVYTAPDLDVSKLSEEEYGSEGSTGHLIVHLDKEQSIDLIRDLFGEENAETVLEDEDDLSNILAFYQVGNKAIMVQLSSFGEYDHSVVLDYLAERGLENPTEVRSSEEAVRAYGYFLFVY